ncbi:phage integrase N-terminal SAM-like domain-containing protein [Pseudoxanthomonas putridarboris]|uniref:Phage integrase N-terminal SAM-like domain-containing protein n=1 Tax=Pseudoxanthomonas putridarboris TaxID=752605 RepID=A0ABU9J590_9GAMM
MSDTSKDVGAAGAEGNASRRLMDEVRRKLRARHYGVRTSRAYLAWIGRFILANGRRHPRDMGTVEVEAFLSHLAISEHVSGDAQSQALSALLFLYRDVLEVRLPWLELAHALRHCLAARLPEAGHDIRTMQVPPGHKEVSTIRIHVRVLPRDTNGMPASPPDR